MKYRIIYNPTRGKDNEVQVKILWFWISISNWWTIISAIEYVEYKKGPRVLKEYD